MTKKNPKPLNDEVVRKLLEKHKGNHSAVARELKVGVSRIDRWVRTQRRKALDTPRKGLKEFCAAHDRTTFIPKKIREALKAMGPNHWEYERDFVRIAGVSMTDLGLARDHFDKHIVVVKRDGKRVWAGSAKFAELLREKVSMT